MVVRFQVLKNKSWVFVIKCKLQYRYKVIKFLENIMELGMVGYIYYFSNGDVEVGRLRNQRFVQVLFLNFVLKSIGKVFQY